MIKIILAIIFGILFVGGCVLVIYLNLCHKREIWEEIYKRIGLK